MEAKYVLGRELKITGVNGGEWKHVGVAANVRYQVNRRGENRSKYIEV